jgi:hypothetical protein
MNWMECGVPQSARRIVHSLPRNGHCSSSSISFHCPRNSHAPLPCVFVTDGTTSAHSVRSICILLFQFQCPLPPHGSIATLDYTAFVTDGSGSIEYTQFTVPHPGRVKRSIRCVFGVHMVLNTQCIVVTNMACQSADWSVGLLHMVVWDLTAREWTLIVHMAVGKLWFELNEN